MTLKVDIREADRWFTGTDWTIKFKVWEADGVTPRNVTGYTMSWLFKRRQSDTDAAALITKTTPTNITVTGVFNIDPAVNTQRVEVFVPDTDTDTIPGGVYLHELKRMDNGQETVLCFGSVTLKGAVHKS